MLFLQEFPRSPAGLCPSRSPALLFTFMQTKPWYSKGTDRLPPYQSHLWLVWVTFSASNSFPLLSMTTSLPWFLPTIWPVSLPLLSLDQWLLPPTLRTGFLKHNPDCAILLHRQLVVPCCQLNKILHLCLGLYRNNISLCDPLSRATPVLWTEGPSWNVHEAFFHSFHCLCTIPVYPSLRMSLSMGGFWCYFICKSLPGVH